jgi:hypothetical protein
MRLPNLTMALALTAALGLCSCVPDVVSIEAVPTNKFARDLAQCNAQAYRQLVPGPSVRHCMKAKGYRFLPQY